jgi:hypothetical protein
MFRGLVIRRKIAEKGSEAKNEPEYRCSNCRELISNSRLTDGMTYEQEKEFSKTLPQGEFACNRCELPLKIR